MNGVLGSFKNMLRRWRINLKNKKKDKTNKKHKLTSFVYSIIAVISFPIGTILSSKENNQKKDINFKQVDKKVLVTSAKKNQDTKGKIILFKKQTEEKVSLNPITKTNENKKIENVLQKINSKIYTAKKTNETIENEVLTPNNKKQTKKIISTTKIEINESELKKELEDLKKEIDKVSLKVSQTTKYNDLFAFERELKELLDKNRNIQIVLQNNSSLVNYIEKSTEIIELIEEKYKEIDLKKEELYFNKKKKSTTEKKKEEQRKELNKKVIDETIQAQKLILRDIAKQNKFFENYLKQLNKSTNGKVTMFYYLKIVSSNLLNFSTSLFPVTLFQNKLLENYVSAIMINNSIKTMRRIINPTLSINYEFFINNYKSNKLLLMDFNNLCDESLEQIEKLRHDIILFGNFELLKEIDLIEKNILKQKENIKLKNNILDHAYVKIKNKAA